MNTDDRVYALVGDGSSDQALMPILNWLLRQHSTVPFRGQWARYLPKGGGLKKKVQYALTEYPCDLLFVHRDMETETYEQRLSEIDDAMNGLAVAYVPVITQRMTEAWLLTSESAIRAASNNPNGKMPLDLPSLKRIEDLPNPKRVLFDLLKTASGLTGRRLDRFDYHRARNRVSERTDDFSPLRSLSAFQKLEAAVITALSAIAGETAR